MSSAKPSESGGEWYREGLRFSCTLCGNCCTGPPGVVWFTPEEGRALATLLELDEETFYKRHARKIDGAWSLNEHETEHGFDCVFLDREKIPGKAVCGVYEARPTQCRTWPFWPEIIRSRGSWEATKRRTPCPGMGEGKLIPVEQIRIQRDASEG